LKGVLENWLNPSAVNPADDIVEQLEAPKPVNKPTNAAPINSVKSNQVNDLPWESESSTETASAKSDVASAFDDLFNN
jgi:hypothetical protein